MVDRVERIEVIVTRNEAEAIHLEQNLIKRHRPPFNVRLRDDKSYPYIAVTVEDDFPRVMFTRERHRRGVVYFGPYANAKKVRETLDVLNRVFPYRPCEGPQPGRHAGIPCLDYHIDRCLAPCVGYVDEGGVPRRSSTASSSSSPARRGRSSAQLEERMAAAVAAAGVRGGGALSEPPRLGASSRRAAGRRQARDRHDRRARDRGLGATVLPSRSSRSAAGGSSTGTASTSTTWPARTRTRSSRPSRSSTTGARRRSRR